MSEQLPSEYWVTHTCAQRQHVIKTADCPWCLIERLRAGLLGHACFCGSSDLEPAVHREDCAYRKWASPEHPRADEPT